MKKNERIIAGFLVSLGLFSAGQAMQYVGTLTDAQKREFVEVRKISKNIVVASKGRGVGDSTWNQDNQNVGQS